MPTLTRTDHLPVARRTWYQPAPSVFTDTERPERVKVTDACFAGTLHGASAARPERSSTLAAWRPQLPSPKGRGAPSG
jgi:hypothetical protein